MIRQGHNVDLDWLVHFVVPAAQFWENIGYVTLELCMSGAVI
jgi:hypothetical protein